MRDKLRYFLTLQIVVEKARKKKLPFTLGDVLYSVYRKRPHHGRYPRSVWFPECREYL